MRNTLICTVGTSLFYHLSQASDEVIKKAFSEKNWKQVCLELLKLDNTERLWGAEINSITSIYNNWTDAGIGLCIETTGRNLAETNTIALHLKETYTK